MAGGVGSFSTAGSGGSATGIRQGITSLSGGGAGPLSSPSAPSGSSTGTTPGTYDIFPLDPFGSASNAARETEQGIAGVKNAIFGTSQPDYTGAHGGLLGDIPGVGALGSRCL